MPATLESILRSAIDEWNHWGKSTWHVTSSKVKIFHTDDEFEYVQYVIDQYCSVCSVCSDKPPLAKIVDNQYFWSAVGMSAIMENAGFSVDEWSWSSNILKAACASNRT